MYPQNREIVLFGPDEKLLQSFVPEIKIRMNKGKAYDLDKVSSSADVYGLLKKIYGRNPHQENFIVLLFNRANKLIGFYKHTIGSSYATIADISMLVGLATKAIAHGVIISHNHPSGSLIPSDADLELTKGLRNALATVKINLLDHIIYTTEKYYSFADEGQLSGINGSTMLNLDNIIAEYPGIDQSVLPDALKKEEFEFILENIDLYSADETIKKYIDTFIEKLNQVVSKSGSGKEDQKEDRKTGKKTRKTKKEVKEERVTKQAARKAKEPEQVEKVSPEVSFIKRYVAMHGKTRDRQQILSLLNSLQKAIVEKRIRKNSPYAKEITTIQKQLIKCYEQMGTTIDVFIEPKSLEKYQKIGQSQKTLPSIAIIKQFISLHGKDGVKDKAQVLADRLARSLENEKISNSDPYIIELMQIRDALQDYLEGKTKRIWIGEAELSGLMGIAEVFPDSENSSCCRNQDELHGPELEETKLPEVIPSTDLPGMHFETIGLQGKYRDLIGDPSVGFSAMVYGLPKSGKSTLCIDFAKHLAKNHGKVLYVAIEEGFGYTLKEKFERLDAIHPNLEIAERLPEDLSPFQFVFIDSVSKAGLTADALTELRKQNPSTAFIYIFHTTKAGKFRGKQDFAHDVDVIVEVEKGEARGNGRFGGGKLIVCL